jgi:hypothetical protein
MSLLFHSKVISLEPETMSTIRFWHLWFYYHLVKENLGETIASLALFSLKKQKIRSQFRYLQNCFSITKSILSIVMLLRQYLLRRLKLHPLWESCFETKISVISLNLLLLITIMNRLVCAIFDSISACSWRTLPSKKKRHNNTYSKNLFFS